MPLPSHSQPIGSLSPSRLDRLECPARVAFEQAGPAAPQPPMGPSGMGEAVHLAMEHGVSGSPAGQAWADARDTMLQLGFDPDLQPNGRKTYRRFERTLALTLVRIEDFGGAKLLPEERIVSHDGLLEGQPDLVLVNSHGFLVVDYKTGFVVVDGETTAKYVRQLELYAYLVSERHHLDNGSAVLISLRDGLVEVDVCTAARSAAAALAREVRETYNDRCPGPQPPNPSLDNCMYCPHSCRCDAFWSTVNQTWVPSFGHAVGGTITSAPEISASGRAAMRVEGVQGTNHSGPLIIGNLPAAAVADAAVGSSVAACHLREQSSDPLVLVSSDRTVLEIDGYEATHGP